MLPRKELQILGIQQIHILRQRTDQSQKVLPSDCPILHMLNFLVQNSVYFSIRRAEEVRAHVTHELGRRGNKHPIHYDQMLQAEVGLCLRCFEYIIENIISKGSNFAIDEQHGCEIGVLRTGMGCGSTLMNGFKVGRDSEPGGFRLIKSAFSAQCINHDITSL